MSQSDHNKRLPLHFILPADGMGKSLFLISSINLGSSWSRSFKLSSMVPLCWEPLQSMLSFLSQWAKTSLANETLIEMEIKTKTNVETNEYFMMLPERVDVEFKNFVFSISVSWSGRWCELSILAFQTEKLQVIERTKTAMGEKRRMLQHQILQHRKC